MTPDNLKPLLKLLRSQGVLKFETPELKVELSESLPRKEPRAEREETEERELTSDELLYYSAPPIIEGNQ